MFEFIDVIIIGMYDSPRVKYLESIQELNDNKVSLLIILDKGTDDLIATFNTQGKTFEQLKTIIETFNQR